MLVFGGSDDDDDDDDDDDPLSVLGNQYSGKSLMCLYRRVGAAWPLRRRGNPLAS